MYGTKFEPCRLVYIGYCENLPFIYGNLKKGLTFLEEEPDLLCIDPKTALFLKTTLDFEPVPENLEINNPGYDSKNTLVNLQLEDRSKRKPNHNDYGDLKFENETLIGYYDYIPTVINSKLLSNTYVLISKPTYRNKENFKSNVLDVIWGD